MIQYIISGVWSFVFIGKGHVRIWRNKMGFFSKLFDPAAGEIKRLGKIVDQIDSFEEAHKKLTDEQLRAKTAEFKARLV